MLESNQERGFRVSLYFSRRPPSAVPGLPSRAPSEVVTIDSVPPTEIAYDRIPTLSDSLEPSKHVAECLRSKTELIIFSTRGPPRLSIGKGG